MHKGCWSSPGLRQWGLMSSVMGEPWESLHICAAGGMGFWGFSMPKRGIKATLSSQGGPTSPLCDWGPFWTSVGPSHDSKEAKSSIFLWQCCACYNASAKIWNIKNMIFLPLFFCIQKENELGKETANWCGRAFNGGDNVPCTPLPISPGNADLTST